MAKGAAVTDLVGCVKLRNSYEIYEDGARFLVRSWSGGQRYEWVLHASNVFNLAKILRGRAVTVREALEELEHRGFEGVHFCYRGGYKQQFEVQAHLLVMVALGMAELEKMGRAFVYRVSTSCWLCDVRNADAGGREALASVRRSPRVVATHKKVLPDPGRTRLERRG
ncbi:MAG: hypothetical protein AB1609_15345 [Bacillota bacterium]